MKFRVIMLSHDVLEDAIREAVCGDLVMDEVSKELVEQFQEVEAICYKWFEDGFKVTLEVDTRTRTCSVVPVK